MLIVFLPWFSLSKSYQFLTVGASLHNDYYVGEIIGLEGGVSVM
ncbi:MULTISPECIES: hypothetical protein [Vibrio]|nr:MULTISPECIES: hypothetical protein [Vibrio]